MQEQRLEDIYHKIEKLIIKLQQLQTENSILKNELESSRNAQIKLESTLENLKMEKQNLENKLNFNTLAPENLSKQEIKSKIDQYISEIDRCIEQIEKL